MTDNGIADEHHPEPYPLRNRHFEELFADPDLIWMGQNTNHLPTHPAVKRALIAAIEDEAYHVDAPPSGLAELRQLIIEDFGVTGGNFVAIDCHGSGVSPEALCDGFLKRGIMIRHAGGHY